MENKENEMFENKRREKETIFFFRKTLVFFHKAKKNVNKNIEMKRQANDRVASPSLLLA